jgi:FK506-binding protein 2
MHLLTAITALAALPLISAAKLETEYQLTHTCKRPSQKGDKIHVHYSGTLLDGTPFDSSRTRGQPFSFTLGGGQVIKGWDQGLLDMCVGDKRKLTIPSDLGYGDRGMGPIPAKSTLVFETELMGIQGVDKEPLVVKDGAAGKVVEDATDKAKSGAAAATDAAGSAASSASEKATKSAASVADAAGSAVSSATDAAGSAAGSVAKDASDAATDAASTVKSAAKDAAASASSLAGEAASSASSVASSVTSRVKEEL